jgi:hypothetical protein
MAGDLRTIFSIRAESDLDPFLLLGIDSGNNRWRAYKRDQNNTSLVIVDGPTNGVATGAYYVVSVVHSGTTIDWYVNGSGVMIGSGLDVPSMGVLNRFSMSALYRTGSQSDWFAGRMGEYIVYSSGLSADERSSVETYVGNRYGIVMA